MKRQRMWGGVWVALLVWGAGTQISAQSLVVEDGGVTYPDGSVQTSASGLPAPVPQTGQMRCYDASGTEIICHDTDQDGELRRGVKAPIPRFTDRGDGTVTDNLSGLMWLKDANCFNAMKWQEALDKVVAFNGSSDSCTDYVAGTFGNWRMPNVRELLSLIDFPSEFDQPLPAGHPFVNTEYGYAWSSTTSGVHVNQDDAWLVSPWGESDETSKSSFNYLWPVRDVLNGGAGGGTLVVADGGIEFPDGSVQVTASGGWPAPVPRTGQTLCYNYVGDVIPCAGTGQDGDLLTGVVWPNPRFTDNGDGTVTDNLTGLIWLQDANCFGELTWEAALAEIVLFNSGASAICTDGAGAFGDWRLPNIRESASLLDFSDWAPPLPPGHPFSNVQSTGIATEVSYWSSSSYTDETYHVDMIVGWVRPRDEKTTSNFVWPVRGGQ